MRIPYNGVRRATPCEGESAIIPLVIKYFTACRRVFYWLVIIAVFIAVLRHTIRRSIYFPMKEIEITPDSFGLAYEEIDLITSGNKKINGWYIPSEKSQYTILFFNGNAGNISHRIEKIYLLHNLGMDVYIFDYRGYGKSEGSPSEQGLYKDAVSIYEYLLKERKIHAGNIVLYGESLGGAVAIDLASKVKVCALITEGTFSSVRDMARVIYPFIPSIPWWTTYDSVSKIKKIICPKLIIHSIDDDIVPFRLGEKLFNSAADPKKLLKIKGSHNTAFMDSISEYQKRIGEFLENLKVATSNLEKE